jgi:putative transposase
MMELYPMSVTEVDQVVVEQQVDGEPVGLDALDEQLLDQLIGQARDRGVKLAGEGGLLQALTKRLLESALEGEITDHLGYERHDASGDGSGNSRNGRRTKTVVTDVGPVEIEVPRDRAGTFEPQIVKKRQRRLEGVDEMVLSLSARGLTHGEISAHLREVYGAEVSKQTISTITDKVIEGMAEWQNRPLDSIYPVIFIDCVHVKIRDGQVANRPIYMALAVTCEGMREILGLWAGDGGEGAKYWMHVLTEIKNRGVADACMVVCDGLKGLPEAIETVWPQAVTQTCVVHLLRASFRYAARQHWDALARALRPVYTAATEDAALERFVEFEAAWGRKYPAIIKLWNSAWAEFVPFLNFDVEIRRVICTTNAIESINARIRRAVRARDHFPNEQTPLANLLTTS